MTGPKRVSAVAEASTLRDTAGNVVASATWVTTTTMYVPPGMSALCTAQPDRCSWGKCPLHGQEAHR